MPMLARRKFVVQFLTVATSLFAFGLIVLGAELLGTVKSVDADAKTITVTPKEGDDVVVKITDATEWYSKKGKIDGFELAKAKKGMELEITHEDKVASKIVIKKGVGKKKKDAN
jgi:hypothetical protein